MKQRNPDLKEDIQSLLEETVLEEATQAIWEAFEKALGNLDAESLVLLRKHFEGVPAEKIANEKGLKTTEVETWLTQVRRELIESLRRDSNIKQ